MAGIGGNSTPLVDPFDPALLASGAVPADLHLHRGLVFLWQQPSPATLARLERDHFDIPILAGRFDSEQPLREMNIPYRMAADFFPLRTQMDFELATIEARARWTGAAEPTYEGMPLLDGDITRLRVWNEMVACAAMFLLIRRVAPNIEIWTDWMGARLVEAVGLKARRLWRADLTDPNLPVNRWVRRQLGLDAVAAVPHASKNRANVSDWPSFHEPADVVFVIGSWVQQRQLDSFPIEALADRGYRVAVWVHEWSDGVEKLSRCHNVCCEHIEFPVISARRSALPNHVSSWCHQAANKGYFAPLRGTLAQRIVRLMGWPRWVAKLQAMYRLLSTKLQQVQPRLVVAPAEKDWTSYCAHYAAGQLGIETVGIKHGTWLTGSYLERVNNAYFFPTGAKHILAFSPDEVYQQSTAVEVPPETQIWCGNPRLEKPECRVSMRVADRSPRILVCTTGISRDRAGMRWRHMIPLQVRFIDALYRRLGSSARVRLHPFDSPCHYPTNLKPLFVTADTPLDQQLLDYSAVATIYSTVSRDAACAGRPVFIWDSDRLDLNQSEVATHGGAFVSSSLQDVCNAAGRFIDDADYRHALVEQAARYPKYIQQSLPDPSQSPTTCMTDWLASLTGPTTPSLRQAVELVAAAC